ncbi:hypothetical protein HAX54_010867, partial [Datura stramonium]|nr:hypothetical protein [Datura stramonium]
VGDKLGLKRDKLWRKERNSIAEPRLYKEIRVAHLVELQRRNKTAPSLNQALHRRHRKEPHAVEQLLCCELHVTQA